MTLEELRDWVVEHEAESGDRILKFDEDGPSFDTDKESAAAEAAWERSIQRFYGSDTPQTDAERMEVGHRDQWGIKPR